MAGLVYTARGSRATSGDATHIRRSSRDSCVYISRGTCHTSNVALVVALMRMRELLVVAILSRSGSVAHCIVCRGILVSSHPPCDKRTTRVAGIAGRTLFALLLARE